MRTLTLGLLLVLAGSALLELARGDEDIMGRSDSEEIDTTDVAAVKAKVRAMYEKYNPEKLEKLDTIMFRYKGRESDLLRDLEDKYKDAPVAATEKPSKQLSIEEQITALYKEHAPDKLDKVPGLLKKYKGSEAKLLRTIQEKYGVQATEDAPAPAPAEPPPPPSEPFMYRLR